MTSGVGVVCGVLPARAFLFLLFTSGTSSSSSGRSMTCGGAAKKIQSTMLRRSLRDCGTANFRTSSDYTWVGGSSIFHLLVITLGRNLRGCSTANFERWSIHSIGRPRYITFSKKMRVQFFTQKWWEWSSSSEAKLWEAWTVSREDA